MSSASLICVWERRGEANYVCSRCGWQALLPLEQACYPLENAPPPKHDLSCAHRGEQLREEGCAGCPGTVYLKVYACSAHGACTIGTPLEAIACCFPDGVPCPQRMRAEP